MSDARMVFCGSGGLLADLRVARERFVAFSLDYGFTPLEAMTMVGLAEVEPDPVDAHDFTLVMPVPCRAHRWPPPREGGVHRLLVRIA